MGRARAAVAPRPVHRERPEQLQHRRRSQPEHPRCCPSPASGVSNDVAATRLWHVQRHPAMGRAVVLPLRQVNSSSAYVARTKSSGVEEQPLAKRSVRPPPNPVRPAEGACNSWHGAGSRGTVGILSATCRWPPCASRKGNRSIGLPDQLRIAAGWSHEGAAGVVVGQVWSVDLPGPHAGWRPAPSATHQRRAAQPGSGCAGPASRGRGGGIPSHLAARCAAPDGDAATFDEGERRGGRGAGHPAHDKGGR